MQKRKNTIMGVTCNTCILSCSLRFDTFDFLFSSFGVVVFVQRKKNWDAIVLLILPHAYTYTVQIVRWLLLHHARKNRWFLLVCLVIYVYFRKFFFISVFSERARAHMCVCLFYFLAFDCIVCITYYLRRDNLRSHLLMVLHANRCSHWVQFTSFFRNKCGCVYSLPGPAYVYRFSKRQQRQNNNDDVDRCTFESL